MSTALLLLAEQLWWTKKISEIGYQENYHTMKTEGGCQSLLKIAQKIRVFFLFQ